MSRSQYYKQTFHPTKQLASMKDHWPQAGETMSDYLEQKKKATAVQTLEKCVTEHPELTYSLLSKLDYNRAKSIINLREAALATDSAAGTKPSTCQTFMQKRQGT